MTKSSILDVAAVLDPPLKGNGIKGSFQIRVEISKGVRLKTLRTHGNVFPKLTSEFSY